MNLKAGPQYVVVVLWSQKSLSLCLSICNLHISIILGAGTKPKISGPIKNYRLAYEQYNRTLSGL